MFFLLNQSGAKRGGSFQQTQWEPQSGVEDRFWLDHSHTHEDNEVQLEKTKTSTEETPLSSPCSGVGFWWCHSPAFWFWRYPGVWSRSGKPSQLGVWRPAPRRGEPGRRPGASSRPPPCACTATARLFQGGNSCYLQAPSEQNTARIESFSWVTSSSWYESPSRSKTGLAVT